MVHAVRDVNWVTHTCQMKKRIAWVMFTWILYASMLTMQVSEAYGPSDGALFFWRSTITLVKWSRDSVNLLSKSWPADSGDGHCQSQIEFVLRRNVEKVKINNNFAMPENRDAWQLIEIIFVGRGRCPLTKYDDWLRSWHNWIQISNDSTPHHDREPRGANF